MATIKIFQYMHHSSCWWKLLWQGWLSSTLESVSKRNAGKTESRNEVLEKFIPPSVAKSSVEASNAVPQEENIFADNDWGKKAEEELGPATTIQLAEVALKCWTQETKKPYMASKIVDGLIIPANFPNIRVPVLNGVIARSSKFMSYHKRPNKRLPDVQKWIALATRQLHCSGSRDKTSFFVWKLNYKIWYLIYINSLILINFDTKQALTTWKKLEQVCRMYNP